MQDKIKELIKFRRTLHQYPEIGYQEYKTSKLICEKLQELRKVPSMFYFIGARDTKEPCYFLHHPKVIINENCIEYGVNFLAKSALKLLSETSN